MADPKHPRHYDEAFKRQIVQLYESGKPSRKIRRRGPTSSGPSSWATPTPGSRRPTTGSRSPSAWPTASTTRTIPSPSSCSASADSTYAHHNQEPNPRKQQKPHMYWTFLRREGGVTAALRCENARLRSWALTVEPAIMAQATIATRRY